MENLKQRPMKLGTETGSLTNYMMSCNRTMPVVGKGATVMSWTDRHAHEITWVSEDGMSCKIRQYNPKVVGGPYQYGETPEYEYKELYEHEDLLVYHPKTQKWKRHSESIVFCGPYYKEYETACQSAKTSEDFRKLDEQFFAPYRTEPDENGWVGLKLVKGITRLKKDRYSINIIFGVKDEYYDPTF